MTMHKVEMTAEWRDELVWTLGRVWAREGQQAALRYLALVGIVYGQEEEERVAYAVMAG